MPRSSKWSLLFRLADHNFLSIYHLPLYTTCPTLFILLYFIMLIIFNKEKKPWSSSLWSFLQPHHFIPFRSKYSKHPVVKHTQSMFSWNHKTMFHTHTKQSDILCKTSQNGGLLWWGVVSPQANAQSEGPLLVGVYDCLLNIFAATLHMWRPCPSPATWGCVTLWRQGIHLVIQEQNKKWVQNSG